MDRQLPTDVIEDAQRLVAEEQRRQGILAGVLGRVSEYTKSGLAVVRDRSQEGLSNREQEIGARWSPKYERKAASNPYNRRMLRWLQRQSPSWRKLLRSTRDQVEVLYADRGRELKPDAPLMAVPRERK